jgi:hypothetical protein
MKCKAIIPTALLLLLLYIPKALAYEYGIDENQKQVNYLWANLGIGSGTQWPYPAFGLGVSCQIMKHHLISIRGVTFIGIGEENIVFTLRDVGILYGFSTRTPQSHGYCSFAIGVSYASEPYTSAVGIPIELQLILPVKSKRPEFIGGIGIYGFADINPKKSFIGLLLCAQLGRIW